MNSIKDDLAKDLQTLINDASQEDYKLPSAGTIKIDQQQLMQNLTIYITRRDSKVFSHAYQLGQKKERAILR